MGRRAKPKRSTQHSKDKKRPGHWHQGESLARQQVPRLRVLDAAAAEHERIAADTAAYRGTVRDSQKLLEQLDRAAPFVPQWVP